MVPLMRIHCNQTLGLIITGFVGSMVNTIFVMSSIYFMFAAQYAQAKEAAVSAVFGLIMATVASSGVPEAIAAAILVTALGKILLRLIVKLRTQ